jgi:hypothetical protein
MVEMSCVSRSILVEALFGYGKTTVILGKK